MKLTKWVVERLQAPARGYAIQWDGELKGFGVRGRVGSRPSAYSRLRAAVGRSVLVEVRSHGLYRGL
ncbi:MAG: hypothetical protein ACREYC_06670 [Gammaproteobacteria bacterium]